MENGRKRFANRLAYLEAPSVSHGDRLCVISSRISQKLRTGPMVIIAQRAMRREAIAEIN